MSPYVAPCLADQAVKQKPGKECTDNVSSQKDCQLCHYQIRDKRWRDIAVWVWCCVNIVDSYSYSIGKAKNVYIQFSL